MRQRQFQVEKRRWELQDAEFRRLWIFVHWNPREAADLAGMAFQAFWRLDGFARLKKVAVALRLAKEVVPTLRIQQPEASQDNQMTFL